MEEVLDSFWYYKTSTMYTALPCSVIKVDNNLAQQRVDVKPLINRLFKDDTSEELPVILAVPVVFPASKTSAFTFPINVGDTVLCVFSQRSLDTFKAGTGNVATPNDFRKFNARDAVAIPGLFPFANAINNPSKHTLPHSTQDTVVAHNIGTVNEAEVRISPDGQIKLTSPLKVVVASPNAEFTGNVAIAGSATVGTTLTATTDVIGGGKSLKNHTHTSAAAGQPTSSPN